MPEQTQTPDEGTQPENETPKTENEETKTPEQTEPETLETPAEPEDKSEPGTQPDQPDYRGKFVESQRENIIERERTKAKDTRINELTTAENPTDEEMRVKYPEWEQLDAFTKNVLKNQHVTEKRLNQTHNVALSLQQRIEWDEKLDEISENPKFAKLKGREAEFKRFAKRKANIGLNPDTLAQAFLFDVADEIEKPHEYKPKNTLEKGSGGPKTPVKVDTKISSDEAARIRKADPKRYNELVKQGRI